MKIARDIAEFILERQHLLITSHARPDGDSIGSQLALSLALDLVGKESSIRNADPCPSNYRRLPGAERIQTATEVNGAYDGLIVLECANLKRTGVGGLDSYAAVNIDHHLQNDNFAQLNWVDPSAAAVAELVFVLLRELEVRITPDIAANLYTGIITDTGSFRFPNTTAETFRIAGELVHLGVQPGRIAQDILMSQSESRLRLLARLLDSMQISPNRKIAWISLEQKMLKETGAKMEDTEGLVNHPLSIDGVLICAFFKEQEDGSLRISLRSKGDIDVSQVARSFGGGGHRNAAGLSFKGEMEDAQTQLIGELERLL